jgi:hypothetical protein
VQLPAKISRETKSNSFIIIMAGTDEDEMNHSFTSHLTNLPKYTVNEESKQIIYLLLYIVRT